MLQPLGNTLHYELQLFWRDSLLLDIPFFWQRSRLQYWTNQGNSHWHSVLPLSWCTNKGRAIAQAVSRWLPTSVTRVRVRGACGVCGGQSSMGAGFLRVLRFPLPIIPPISPSSYSPRAGTIGHWWPQCRVDPIGLHPPLYQLKKKLLTKINAA
jgi:hypothetical protein